MNPLNLILKIRSFSTNEGVVNNIRSPCYTTHSTEILMLIEFLFGIVVNIGFSSMPKREIIERK